MFEVKGIATIGMQPCSHESSQGVVSGTIKIVLQGVCGACGKGEAGVVVQAPLLAFICQHIKPGCQNLTLLHILSSHEDSVLSTKQHMNLCPLFFQKLSLFWGGGRVQSDGYHVFF